MSELFGIIDKETLEIQTPASEIQREGYATGFDLIMGLRASPYVSSSSRIDYRDELIGKLGHRSDATDQWTDQQLLAHAYGIFGKAMLQHLEGEFAFAILDQEKGRLLCARDHFGCRPFYYYNGPRFLAFAEDIGSVLSLLEEDPVPDQDSLFRLYASRAAKKERTFYAHIKRLPPAHFMHFSTDKGIEIRPYWELTSNPKYESLGVETAVKQFSKLFGDAIMSRCAGNQKVGVELSGGLDSSAITASLAQRRNEGPEVYAYTHVLSEENQKTYYPFTDERARASMMATHAGLKVHRMVDAGAYHGGLSPVARAMEIGKQPVIQLFPVFSDLLHRQASKDGIRVLFSGFGGDECVTAEGQEVIGEFLSQGKWIKAWKEMPSTPLIKKMKSFLAYFRRQAENPQRYRSEDLAVHPSLLAEFSLNEESWDHKRKNAMKTHQDLQKFRLQHPHVSERLEQSYLLAKSYGLNYVYPFLDIRLVTFVYSLPPGVQYFGGLGRRLVRESLRGSMPEMIRLEPSKFGASIPNIFYRLMLDDDAIRDMIQEARLANNFHYLDYDKLLWQWEELKKQDKMGKRALGPKVFISSLSMLMTQKWERENKMKSGIRIE